jgi:hypothetical protein
VADFLGRNGRIVSTGSREKANNPEGDQAVFTVNAVGSDVVQLTRNDVADACAA